MTAKQSSYPWLQWWQGTCACQQPCVLQPRLLGVVTKRAPVITCMQCGVRVGGRWEGGASRLFCCTLCSSACAGRGQRVYVSTYVCICECVYICVYTCMCVRVQDAASLPAALAKLRSERLHPATHHAAAQARARTCTHTHTHTYTRTYAHAGRSQRAVGPGQATL